MELRGATKPLILIGIPTFGEHSYMFTQSLLGAIMPTNHSMTLRFLPGWEVGRARNMLMQEAVDVGAKYVMFRDEDTLAPANLVPALLYHLETKPELTFVGGLYATKSQPPEPLVYKDWGVGPDWGWKKGEFIPVLYTGMGASMIRVADLAALECETYEEKNPWTGQPVTVRALFKTGDSGEVRTGGVMKSGHTEDAHFFAMLEAAGLKAAVDTSLECGHYDKNTRTIFYTPFDSGVAQKPDPWNATPCIVNLGAGKEDDPNEVRVDLRDEPGMFRADIRRLPADWGEHFDIAKAHHVLEHFDFKDSAEVLTEWLRILKPGGELQLTVPDLQCVAEEIVGGRFDALVQGNIYGDQGHPFWRQPPYGGYDQTRYLPHSHQHNHHNSGYTARHLISLMQDIGFTDVRAERHTDSWELYVVGRKPEEINDGD